MSVGHQPSLWPEFQTCDRYMAWARARRVQVLINVTDIEAECDHGALPFDRKKPAGCECWTEARTDALANRVQENPDYSDAA